MSKKDLDIRMPQFFDDWMNIYKRANCYDHIDYIEMLVIDYDRGMLSSEMTNGLVIREISGNVVECYCYDEDGLEKEITEDEIAKTRYMKSWWHLREEVK